MPTPESLENLADEETTTATADEETTDGSADTQEEESETTEESENEDPVKTRHSQQMEGAKKEVEKWKGTSLEVAKKAVSYEPELLVRLHKTDPKFAKQVGSELDFSQTERGTYEKFIQSEGKPIKEYEEDKESYYQRRRAEEKHEEAIQRAEKRLAKDVPEEYQEDVKAKFDKIVQGKRLDEDDAMEYLEMAIKYVVKPTNDGSAIAKVATTPVKKSSKESKTIAYIDPITGKFTTKTE